MRHTKKMTAAQVLLTLEAVRQRTALLLTHHEHLDHFTFHPDKLEAVVTQVLALIKRDYSSPVEIPPHSRWRHFEAVGNGKSGSKDRIGQLVEKWRSSGTDEKEVVRRLLDLFVVSVLLDAGAGSQWVYHPRDEPKETYSRSEGLAIASLDWFTAGGLSISSSNKFQADADGLIKISAESLAEAFQVTPEGNPLAGLAGRCQLLQRLGDVLLKHPQYFGPATGSGYCRPGNIVDFLLSHSNNDDGTQSVSIDLLWEVVMKGLSGVWPPTRTSLDGAFLGDVWPSQSMKRISAEFLPVEARLGSEFADSLVPFHKLSQWLTYSLMEPLSLLQIVFEGADKMTGLAEYRNGGLFVDHGVIQLKQSTLDRLTADQWTAGGIPRFAVHDEAVVEWRALTVALLDRVAELVRKQLGLTAKQLSLAKVLEAGNSILLP